MTLMDKRQLAARLGIPVGTVDKKVSRREWPFTKIGRHVRFTEEHFAEIVRMGEQPALSTPPVLSVVRLGHPPSGPHTPPPPPAPPRPPKVRAERVA